jgi:ketosteroid isomerase-like protein
MTPGEVEAREAIRDLVARYNANGDSGRFGQVLSLFAPDAVMELDGERLVGRDAIEALFARTRERITTMSEGRPGHVRHFTATHQIDMIDADHAGGRCYFQVLMAHGLDHWGRYVDQYVLVDGQWLFAERHITVDGRAPDSAFA